MVYGYARVSSVDQNLERQLAQFEEFGISKKCIYIDKKSGKDFIRDNYLKLIKKIKRGDLLVVKSIDRLGRNYVMITSEWQRITNEIGADILVLDMPLLDTRDKNNSLMGKFISDVVLQVLSFVAENERILVNGKFAKPSKEVKIGDEITIEFGNKSVTVRVASLEVSTKKADAINMYEFISDVPKEFNDILDSFR